MQGFLSTFKVLPGVNYYGNSSICLIWLHMAIIGALWNYIGGLGKERGKYEKPLKTTICFYLVQELPFSGYFWSNTAGFLNGFHYWRYLL